MEDGIQLLSQSTIKIVGNNVENSSDNQSTMVSASINDKAEKVVSKKSSTTCLENEVAIESSSVLDKRGHSTNPENCCIFGSDGGSSVKTLSPIMNPICNKTNAIVEVGLVKSMDAEQFSGNQKSLLDTKEETGGTRLIEHDSRDDNMGVIGEGDSKTSVYSFRDGGTKAHLRSSLSENEIIALQEGHSSQSESQGLSEHTDISWQSVSGGILQKSTTLAQDLKILSTESNALLGTSHILSLETEIAPGDVKTSAKEEDISLKQVSSPILKTSNIAQTNSTAGILLHEQSNLLPQKGILPQNDDLLLPQGNTSVPETSMPQPVAHVLLQTTNNSLTGISISSQETSVSIIKESNVLSRETSVSLPAACVSSQEVIKTTSDLSSNDGREVGLDLICDDDSDSTWSYSSSVVASTSNADLDSNCSNSKHNSPLRKNLRKRKRNSSQMRQSSDNIPIAPFVKPEWLKPFEQGWRRELVLRKDVDTSGVRPADVYYYAPSGKKLRSMPELCLHLKDEKNSIDGNCFTFSKFTIHKEPFETVRSAGVPGGKLAQSLPICQAMVSDKKSPKRCLPLPKKKLKTDDLTVDIASAQLRNLKRSPRKRLLSVRMTDQEKPKTERSKIIKKCSVENVGQKLCGWNCPGSEGVPPTLPCGVCMCMFHPRCVKFVGRDSSFTCQACKTQASADHSMEARTSTSSKSSKIPALRAMAPFSASKVLSDASSVRGPPPLHLTTATSGHDVRAPPPLVFGPSQGRPLMIPMTIVQPVCIPVAIPQPVFAVSLPSVNSTASIVHFSSVANACPMKVLPLTSGSNTVRLSALPSQIQTLAQTVTPAVTQAVTQTVTQATTKHLKLVLPPKIASQLDAGKPLALKINGQQLLLQPSEFLQISNGIRILLPDNMVSKNMMSSLGTTMKSVNTIQPSRLKAPAHEDENEICIIEPDLSLEKETSREVLTTLQSVNVSKMQPSLEIVAVSAASLSTEPLCSFSENKSTTQQMSLEMSTLPHSGGLLFSTAQTLRTVDTVTAESTRTVPFAQKSVLSQKTIENDSDADIAIEACEPGPAVIHIDTDNDSDSGSRLSSETNVSIACQVSHVETSSSKSSTLCSTSQSEQHLLTVSSVCSSSASSALGIMSNDTSAVPSFQSLLLDGLPTQSSDVLESTTSKEVFSSECSSLDLTSVEINNSRNVTSSNESEKNAVNGSDVGVSSSKRLAKNISWSSFGPLHAGFNSMLKIFKFLGICDLLQIATVCKIWQHMSLHPDLWRCVRLRGCHIKDWQLAAAHFQRMNTHHLDMKGVLQKGDSNTTWSCMVEHMPCLSALKIIECGQCSVKVLDAVVENLHNITSFTAEVVQEGPSDLVLGLCSTFDLAKFANLQQLKHLKLRGVPGISLPVYGDPNILLNLCKLKQLQNLSLTTLKDVEGKDLKFIGSLLGLKVLEIGNCYHWTKETFVSLANLVNLTSLRLESGGDAVDAGLGDALKKMTSLQQLELIRYFVADNLAIIFPTLNHLKTFFIWPEVQEKEVQVGRQNSIILSAVSGMSFLRRLFWGITLDSRSAAELPSVSNAHQQTIPFLLRTLSTAQVDQRLLSTRLLTINEIVSALSDRLPDTKIQVFQVPAQDQSHRRNI